MTGTWCPRATILRPLRDEGLILPANCQRQRRKLARRRQAAFASDYWRKYEHQFHVPPTGNQHDQLDAIELALAGHEAMSGHPLDPERRRATLRAATPPRQHRHPSEPKECSQRQDLDDRGSTTWAVQYGAAETG
jgi:hypothetical protein